MGLCCSACAKDRLFNSEGDFNRIYREPNGCERGAQRRRFQSFLCSSETRPMFNVAVETLASLFLSICFILAVLVQCAEEKQI